MKLFNLFYLSVLLLFLGKPAGSVYANTLNAGDLAVYGWNSYTYKVELVTFVDLPVGTVIKITDFGWINNTNAFTTTTTTDGIVTWTVGSAVTAGSLFTLTLAGSAGAPTLFNNTTGTDISSQVVQTYFSSGTIPMTATGDGIFIYQDSDTNPYFIFGFNNSNSAGTSINLATGWNSAIAVTLRDSQLPNGTGSQNALTVNTNAIGMYQTGYTTFFRNVQFTGPVTTADHATWLTRMTNRANWTGDSNGSPGATSSTVLHATPGSMISLTNPLPLTLISFTGEITKDGAVLNWHTESETVITGFDIEKSTDGINFSSIGNVHSGMLQYEFLDKDFVGQAYYRLKIIEEDGTSTFSKVIVLSQKGSTSNYSIVPNPVSDHLKINTGNEVAGNINVLIEDITGKVYHHSIITAADLNNGSAIINTSSLKAGLYLLKIGNVKTQSQTTFKFIKD